MDRHSMSGQLEVVRLGSACVFCTDGNDAVNRSGGGCKRTVPGVDSRPRTILSGSVYCNLKQRRGSLGLHRYSQTLIRGMETANVELYASNGGNITSPHILPMASKSREQRSLWASNVEHTLRIMREEMHNEADMHKNVVNEFRILKVPECDRQPTAEYTPVEWRFGLHNRDGNLDMTDAEAAKRAVAVLFGLDEQSEWRTFCDIVVPDPRAMLKCYGLHSKVNGLLEDEIKQVLAFDALFLAVRIELLTSMDWDSRILVIRELWDEDPMWRYFKQTFRRCYELVHLDLCKIENQIPFDLIKNAIKHVQKRTNPTMEDHASPTNIEGGQVPTDAYLERWKKAAVKEVMAEFMDISDDFYKGANKTQILTGSHHFMDAAYKVVCGVDGKNRTSDYSQTKYIHVPSATRLKESGITIEGVFGPLSALFYDKKMKCLHVPKMGIYDNTVSLVRNMARYEEYRPAVSGKNKCMLHDYVMLMLDLIEAPLDLEHLITCGVVYNGCGNRGVDMWRALNEGLRFGKSSEEHNKLKRDINNRCNLKRYRLWSEFKTLFYQDHG